MGKTLKQVQRSNYIAICKGYNLACSRVAEALPETTVNFVHYSLELQSAKGWEHIPKSWCTNAFITKQGE